MGMEKGDVVRGDDDGNGLWRKMNRMEWGFPGWVGV